MKRSFKVSTKIWLIFIIMVLGYLSLVILSSGFGKQMKFLFHTVSDYFIPATDLSKEALAAFHEQMRLYNDVVMTGEKTSLEAAQTQAARVQDALAGLLKLRGLDQAKKKRVTKLLADLNEFTVAAHATYHEFSAGNVTDALQTTASQLAETKDGLQRELERLVKEVGAELAAEMASVDDVTRRHGERNAFVSVSVSILAFGLILLILKHSIVRPIRQIVAIAENVKAGKPQIEWLPESRNEFGILSNALRTMTEKLQAEIAERKQAQLSLLQAEKRYRMIFENSLEGIFQIRIDGRIFNANPAMASILRYDSPDELLAAVQHFTEQIYVNPADRAAFEQILCDKGKMLRFETQLRCHDGNVIWASISARSVPDPTGKMLYYEGSLIDVTERKQAEALQEAYKENLEREVQERTRELSETLAHLQTTQQELVESARMAALGQLVAGVAHEINTPLGAIRASIGNIANALSETANALPRLLQLLSAAQLADFFALVAHALQSKTFLTSREERTLRRALRQELETLAIANADATADTLVDMGVYQNIAPFAPLLQSVHAPLILQTAYNLAVQQHNCENIMTAVERAARVVFALKSYAHYDHSGEKTAANILEGIDVVLTLYHNQLKHGIEVVKHYADIPAIRCYADELKQVWTNLLQNAIHAMGGHGTLEIRVTRPPAPSLWKREGAPAEGSALPPALFQREGAGGEFLLVQITDSGSGIPADIRERIFEPFFTTKPAGEGSGLGLDICKKIIEKHQGGIAVTSLPGRTTFSVTLPISA